MQMIHPQDSSLITPGKTETTLARETSRRLAVLLGEQSEYQIQLLENGHPGAALAIPATAMRLLVRILSEMANGNAVTVIPVHAALSTQRAADLLNVSRPFLIRLLEDGKIPFHKVGSHRRVRSSDLIDYKNRIDAQRLKVLEELAAQSQRLDMGY